MTPVELRQLLQDVFAYLDEEQKIDVRDEPDEAAGPRLLRFLYVLKVSVPTDPAAQ